MELKDVLKELESHADEGTKAVYIRQGAESNVLGVNYNHLKRLKKKINGYDTKLGVELWNTKIIDAQSFATMIIDPDETDIDTLDKMAHELTFHQLSDIFINNIVSKTEFMPKLFEKWMQSDNKFVRRAGWQILSKIATHDKSLEDSFFLPFIKTIEENIKTSEDIIKESMNACLIAIGIRNDELEKEVADAEEKIGKLFNKDSIFSFRFPSPLAYIQKMKEIKDLGARPY